MQDMPINGPEGYILTKTGPMGNEFNWLAPTGGGGSSFALPVYEDTEGYFGQSYDNLTETWTDTDFSEDNPDCDITLPETGLFELDEDGKVVITRPGIYLTKLTIQATTPADMSGTAYFGTVLKVDDEISQFFTISSEVAETTVDSETIIAQTLVNVNGLGMNPGDWQGSPNSRIAAYTPGNKLHLSSNFGAYDDGDPLVNLPGSMTVYLNIIPLAFFDADTGESGGGSEVDSGIQYVLDDSRGTVAHASVAGDLPLSGAFTGENSLFDFDPENPISNDVASFIADSNLVTTSGVFDIAISVSSDMVASLDQAFYLQLSSTDIDDNSNAVYAEYAVAFRPSVADFVSEHRIYGVPFIAGGTLSMYLTVIGSGPDVSVDVVQLTFIQRAITEVTP